MLFCVVEDEVVCYKNAIIHLLPRLKTRLNNKGIYVTDLKKALHFLPLIKRINFICAVCMYQYVNLAEVLATFFSLTQLENRKQSQHRTVLEKCVVWD